jgi:hypothetical protein
LRQIKRRRPVRCHHRLVAAIASTQEFSMKPSSSFPLHRGFGVLLLAASLAGCAALGGGDKGEHVHPTGTAAPGHGGTPGQQGMGMGMDMQAMCDMHRKKMAGKTAQERHAAMEEHMRTMPADQRERMQAMMQQCK